MSKWAYGFVSLFLIAVFAGLSPAEAQSGIWTTETISGVAGGISDMQIVSSTGTKMGIAYQLTVAQTIGFVLRTAPGVYTAGPSDISGNGTKLWLDMLGFYTGTTWFIVGHDVNGGTVARVWVYRSTDDGTTWTKTYFAPYCVGSSGNNNVNSPVLIGDTVSLVFSVGSASGCSPNGATNYNGVNYATVEHGTTGRLFGCTTCSTPVAAPLKIYDNFGDAAHDYGATAIAPNYWDWNIYGRSHAAVIAGTAVTFYTVLGNGYTWTIPYTTEGGSTPKVWTSTTYSTGPTDMKFATIGNAGAVWVTASSDSYVDAEVNVNTGAVHTKLAYNPCSGTAATAGRNHLPVINYLASNTALVPLNCGASGGSLRFALFQSTNAAPATVSTVYTDTTANVFVDSATQDSTYSYVGYHDLSGGNAPRLIFAQTSLIVPIVAADATSTHVFSGTEGTAFALDVDSYDKLPLVKFITSTPVANTYTAEAFNPDSNPITQRGSTFQTGCNSEIRNGIFSYYNTTTGRQFAGITTCNSNTCSSVKCTGAVAIRGGDLGFADLTGTACAGVPMCCSDSASAPPCATDLTTSSHCRPDGGFSDPVTTELPGGAQQINSLQTIPIDFGRTAFNSVTQDSRITVGFAFSDYGNGKVGVWANTFRPDVTDDSCQWTTDFTSAGNTQQICSWRNPHDKFDYMAAASLSSATTVWRVLSEPFGSQDPTTTSSDLGSRFTLNVQGTYAGLYAQSYGISCAGNALVMMDSSGRVSIMHTDAAHFGTPYLGTNNFYSGILPGGEATFNQHPVTISADENVTAFLNGTTVTIACTRVSTIPTTGTCAGGAKGVIGTVALPAGVFIDMRLDDLGHTLWVLTSTTLARYDMLLIPSIAANLPNPTLVNGQRCQNNVCVSVDNDGNHIIQGTGGGGGGTGGGGVSSDSFIGAFITPFLGDLGSMGELILGLIIIGFMTGLFLLIGRNSNAKHWFVLFGSGIGYVIAIKVANFPMWPVVAIVVVSLTLIVFRFRSGNAGGA